MSMRGLIQEGRWLLERVPNVPTWQGSSAGTYSINPSGNDLAYSVFPDPAFPFHTQAADEVFKTARDLIVDNPTLRPSELMGLAITTTGYTYHDLTPEDRMLMIMAIDWVQNGPPKPLGKTRSPGAPGGGVSNATHIGVA